MAKQPKKPKEYTVEKPTHRLVFTLEGKGPTAEVICKAYKKDANGAIGEQTLDWVFPHLAAINPLAVSAMALTEQAMMYANDPNFHPNARGKA